MIDQPEESAVNLRNILQPHRQRTARRMMGQKTVLYLQDGSELNYTNLEKCSGLGVLKANQTGAKMKGLKLHTTFAIAPNGLPGHTESTMHCPASPQKYRLRKKRPLFG